MTLQSGTVVLRGEARVPCIEYTALTNQGVFALRYSLVSLQYDIYRRCISQLARYELHSAIRLMLLTSPSPSGDLSL